MIIDKRGIPAIRSSKDVGDVDGDSDGDGESLAKGSGGWFVCSSSAATLLWFWPIPIILRRHKRTFEAPTEKLAKYYSQSVSFFFLLFLS